MVDDVNLDGQPSGFNLYAQLLVGVVRPCAVRVDDVEVPAPENLDLARIDLGEQREIGWRGSARAQERRREGGQETGAGGGGGHLFCGQGSSRRGGTHPAVDLPCIRKHAHEGLAEASLSGRFGRAHQKRVELVHSADHGSVGAAPMRLLRIPVALKALDKQIL